jgi:DNA-binding beta-propeller fold protein YncE
VDSSGNVYVADTGNNRIQKFTSNGVFVTKWGSKGTGDGQFNAPRGVAVDSSGNIYVADYYNNRIQKFTSNGVFVTKWGSSARGVAVDSLGNVYVADSDRMQKFTSDGGFLTKWGSGGTENGQFYSARGVAVDSWGDVYVADTCYNHRIQKFGPVDPLVLVRFVIEHVGGLNLQRGIANSLDAKLQAALQALEDVNQKNDVAAINILGAFINAVQPQRGKKIPQADADALIARTQYIIAQLSGE